MGGATPKLAYDVLTKGVGADQTPRRLHTILDADTGGALSSWDEIKTGEGRGLFVGAVSIGTTTGAGFSIRDAMGNFSTPTRHMDKPSKDGESRTAGPPRSGV